MVPLTRKIYFISICVLCIIIVLILLWEINDGNAKLMWNEIKAYFKPGISLEFHPDIESIESIEIAGVITTNFCEAKINEKAVYYEKENIELLTNYLNNLNLVNASEDELPNISADASIVYYGKNNKREKEFIIYGQVFIKDISSGNLYRTKHNSQIIDGLEKLCFK